MGFSCEFEIFLMDCAGLPLTHPFTLEVNKHDAVLTVLLLFSIGVKRNFTKQEGIVLLILSDRLQHMVE
jgi:hypothetical protein